MKAGGHGSLRKTAALLGLPIAVCASAAAAQQDSIRYDDVFKSAVAVWHMKDLKDAAGKNALEAVGSVTLNIPLTGRERAESLAAGSATASWHSSMAAIWMPDRALRAC